MRAVDHDHRGHGRGTPFDAVVLAHDERTLRRRLLTLRSGAELLVDLPATVALQTGDVLVLEDGRLVEIIAAEEALHAVKGRDARHVMELCWHIGNRHLPCQIIHEEDGNWLVLIGRDPVIGTMLEGLGATVSEVFGPFSPIRGAYSGEGHAHGHHHPHHG